MQIIPASDYLDRMLAIYSCEQAIEEAWRDILIANGMRSYTAGSTLTMELPCVTIEMRQCMATGHTGIYEPGKRTFDAWQGILVSTIRTVRGERAVSALWLSKIRFASQYSQLPFTGDSELPYHSVVEIKEAGMNRSIDQDFDLDVVEFALSITFAVKPGAWPDYETIPI